MPTSKEIGTLRFRCNICGGDCQTHMSLLSREQPSCPYCKSTVRMRAMIHVLSEELFGESLMLPDFPKRRDIKGFGMSDWDGYAKLLAEKLDYTNTFYHREPRLDITDIAQELEGSLDFLISTDVFEHVTPPVSRAFVNAHRLLKDDGVFIFSVPYTQKGETIEHFPELFDYHIETRNNVPVLINITRDGCRQEFQHLVFHGGSGETLEMRIFSRPSLQQEFMRAGFAEVEFYAANYFDYGIYWPYFISAPIAARNVEKRKAFGKKHSPFRVEAWGPSETRLNRGFNLQANGASALWLHGQDLQRIHSLKFGETVLTQLTVARAGKVLSVKLAPHLIAQVGKYPVFAVTDSGIDHLIGYFYVRSEV